MKSNIIFSIITVLIAFGLAAGYVELRKPKLAYIELAEVYNNFKMKLELEKELEKVQLERNTILDSLRLSLSVLEKKLMTDSKNDQLHESFDRSRTEYFYKKQQFDEDNERLVSEFQTRIMTQLNQYVKDFGAKYNYEFIYGAQGDGSVMYGSDAMNITSEVKTYVNERYDGKK